MASVTGIIDQNLFLKERPTWSSGLLMLILTCKVVANRG